MNIFRTAKVLSDLGETRKKRSPPYKVREKENRKIKFVIYHSKATETEANLLS